MSRWSLGREAIFPFRRRSQPVGSCGLKIAGSGAEAAVAGSGLVVAGSTDVFIEFLVVGLFSF